MHGNALPSRPATTTASWTPSHIGGFPPPSTPDLLRLLRLLRASLAQSPPFPPAITIAPTQPCAAPPPFGALAPPAAPPSSSTTAPLASHQPPPLPAAHGADLLAFLQGAAWAARLHETVAGGTHRPAAALPFPPPRPAPPPPGQTLSFGGAGPTAHSGRRWAPIPTVGPRPGLAPPGPAFRPGPVATGR
jgi:hypothetical protein